MSEDPPPPREATPAPIVDVDEYQTGEVGCSALVTGGFASAVLLSNDQPLLLVPLWAVLYGVYRYTVATARKAKCPGCDRALHFEDDVARCRHCHAYYRVSADRLFPIEGDHETSGLGFELSLGELGPIGAPVRLPWGRRCCACDAEATGVLELRPASVVSESLGGAMQEVASVTLEFPHCDAHRGAVRTSGGALRFRHHRTWRELVDANR